MGRPKQLKIIGSFSSVLLIRLNDIGEVVMTLPCLDAVRKALPGARIGMLVSPPSHELLQYDKRIDQIFVFKKKLWRSRPTLTGFKQLSGLLLDLRRQRFDVSIDFHNNPSTHWLAFASGARWRVSMTSEYWSRRLMSWNVSPSSNWDQIHNIERHFHLLSSVGIPTRGAEYNFAADLEARSRVREQLRQEAQPGKPIVVMQPGAGLVERCWPVRKFAELAQCLSDEMEAQIVVHCGPGEDHLGERIRQAVSRPIVIARRLLLQELAGLLASCDLMVTNDSGPMHLAAALETPIVAVFGPTNPTRSGPYRTLAEAVSLDMECSPCGIKNLECIKRECLTELAVSDVYDAVLRILEQKTAQDAQKASGIASANAS